MKLILEGWQIFVWENKIFIYYPFYTNHVSDAFWIQIFCFAHHKKYHAFYFSNSFFVMVKTVTKLQSMVLSGKRDSLLPCLSLSLSVPVFSFCSYSHSLFAFSSTFASSFLFLIYWSTRSSVSFFLLNLHFCIASALEKKMNWSDSSFDFFV